MGLAQLTAADLSGIIEAAQHVLEAVGQLPTAQVPTDSACDASFMPLRRFFPRYVTLGIASPEGNVVCGSTARAGDVSVADRRWFRDAVERGTFVVGDYQIGRLTGEATINVAESISDADGSLAGVVYAAIPIGEFTDILADVPLPAGGAVQVLDRVGTIVARYPEPGRWEGHRFPDGPVLDGIRSQPEGGVVQGHGIDGVQREYAIAHMEGSATEALWVVLGLPTVDIEEDANRTLAMTLAALLVLTIVVVAAGWFGAELLVLRPVGSLVSIARQFAAGELSARSDPRASGGVTEVEELGRALDGMAANVEAQIRQTELILGSAGEGICGLNRDGCITFVNPAAAELLGFQEEEVVGQDFHDVVHRSRTDALASESSPILTVLRGADTARGVHDTFWRKDDTPFPVEYTATPIVDRDGVVGVVVVFRDVTERQQAEADRAQRLAAEREAQVKGELVSVVSHELRTPLASIVGFAELLLTREWPERQRREFLETILHEGWRLTALTNDFLDLQRLASGQMELKPRAADLLPLLEKAVASLGPDEVRPIVVDAPETLPSVQADPDRLHQILLNLLSNARKYSPAGGDIQLWARATGEGTVEVGVRDHGLGIPSEALPRLFSKFYRVDSADRQTIAGTGLGLAICKELVEAQGGQISVESAGEGQGATFRFTIPVDDSGHLTDV